MGTRLSKHTPKRLTQDHPHAYGDKHLVEGVMLHDQGSSPRVWGQEMLSLDIIDKDRIIPTRMGTSTKVYHEIMCAGDHPHAYGDKISAVANAALKSGSSPRVWGQVEHSPASEGLFRIIPTRMGTRI